MLRILACVKRQLAQADVFEQNRALMGFGVGVLCAGSNCALPPFQPGEATRSMRGAVTQGGTAVEMYSPVRTARGGFGRPEARSRQRRAALR